MPCSTKPLLWKGTPWLGLEIPGELKLTIHIRQSIPLVDILRYLLHRCLISGASRRMSWAAAAAATAFDNTPPSRTSTRRPRLQPATSKPLEEDGPTKGMIPAPFFLAPGDQVTYIVCPRSLAGRLGGAKKYCTGKIMAAFWIHAFHFASVAVHDDQLVTA